MIFDLQNSIQSEENQKQAKMNKIQQFQQNLTCDTNFQSNIKHSMQQIPKDQYSRGMILKNKALKKQTLDAISNSKTSDGNISVSTQATSQMHINQSNSRSNSLTSQQECEYEYKYTQPPCQQSNGFTQQKENKVSQPDPFYFQLQALQQLKQMNIKVPSALLRSAQRIAAWKSIPVNKNNLQRILDAQTKQNAILPKQRVNIGIRPCKVVKFGGDVQIRNHLNCLPKIKAEFRNAKQVKEQGRVQVEEIKRTFQQKTDDKLLKIRTMLQKRQERQQKGGLTNYELTFGGTFKLKQQKDKMQPCHKFFYDMLNQKQRYRQKLNKMLNQAPSQLAIKNIKHLKGYDIKNHCFRNGNLVKNQWGDNESSYYDKDIPLLI